MNIRVLFFLSVSFLIVTTWALVSITDGAREPGLSEHTRLARSNIDAQWPVSTEQRATTLGSIYTANLDGQISALEKRLERRPDALLSAQLARLLYHRFQVTGRLQDAEAARDIFAGNAAAAAGSLDYARILVGFHEFEKAEAVLNAAAKKGGASDESQAIRRAIAQARGQLEPPVESQDVSPPSMTTAQLVNQAAAWADQDRPDKASELLRLAQNRYTDSSPYVLAWIHVQQGIVFLDQAEYAAARKFFAAAHERFPQYTLAAEHLAETELALGNAQGAAELYREVVARSDHPEFHHQLANAERALGNEEVAMQSAQRAEQKYRELVARYPLMYADHAVGYFIDIGARDEAIALAQANLTQRQDKRSRELLATARECCR